jgi:hypothetical protein
MRSLALSPLLLVAVAGASHAGLADVLSASASCASSVCSFSVTVQHADEGWNHYANAWEVLLPDGSVLATRVLEHPHVAEQPFTRELRDVTVPPGITSVRIRARDSVHGYGGREVVVPLGK